MIQHMQRHQHYLHEFEILGFLRLLGQLLRDYMNAELPAIILDGFATKEETNICKLSWTGSFCGITLGDVSCGELSDEGTLIVIQPVTAVIKSTISKAKRTNERDRFIRNTLYRKW